jgi:DNA-directed RNA polymerase specialized sigma24 family protein
VQDTLERACARWQLWAAGSDLRAWLFTLMHNLFVDGARRAMRQAGTAGGRRRRGERTGGAVRRRDPDQALDLQRCLLRLPTTSARCCCW